MENIVKRLHKTNISTPKKKFHGVNIIFKDIPIEYFREFIIGNVEDVDIVLSEFDKNIFKSFYCTTCTIGYKNQIVVEDGGFKKVENSSIPFDFNFEEIEWKVSETTFSYFDNQLLLTPTNHVEIFLPFLDYKYFNSLAQLSKTLKTTFISPGSCIDINNPNHSFFYITTQKFDIVEKIKQKITLINEEIIDTNETIEVEKVKIVASNDIFKLYNTCSRYVLYFVKNLIQDYNLSFNLFFHSNYYIVLFILSDKDLSLEDKTVFHPFSHTIYTSNQKLRVDKRSIINKYINPEKLQQSLTSFSEYMNSIYNKTSSNILSYPSEFIQAVFFKLQKEGICKFITLYIENLKKELFDNCNLRNKECNIFKFNRYRTILSYFIICTEFKVFNNLIVDVIVKTELYLLKKYKINTFRDSLFLQGPFSSFIISKTFENLVYITHEFPSNTTDKNLMNYNIDKWIDYSNKKKIGDPSAFGVVVLTKLLESGDYPFVMKLNLQKDQDVANMFYQEIAIGMIINTVREHIPNFLTTFGGFNCFSSVPKIILPNRKEIPDIANTSLCTNNKQFDSFVNYILLEFIQGVSLRRYITSITNAQDFFNIMKQITLSLMYSQNKIDFYHQDLHDENIMVSNFRDSESWKKQHNQKDNVQFTYHINGEKYSVLSNILAVIIDYGSSHVKGLQKYEPNKIQSDIGIDSDKYNNIGDLYKIFSFTFTTVLAENKFLDDKDRNKIIDFYIQFYENYSIFFTLTDFNNNIDEFIQFIADESITKDGYTIDEIIDLYRVHSKKYDWFIWKMFYDDQINQDVLKVTPKFVVDLLDLYIDSYKYDVELNFGDI